MPTSVRDKFIKIWNDLGISDDLSVMPSRRTAKDIKELDPGERFAIDAFRAALYAAEATRDAYTEDKENALAQFVRGRQHDEDTPFGCCSWCEDGNGYIVYSYAASRASWCHVDVLCEDCQQADYDDH
jgi:hypothetical protein